MPSKLLTPVLLFLLAAFISCQPSEDDPAPGIPKIKTITHHQGEQVSSVSYEYDALGRFLKETVSDGSYTQCEYQAGTIIWRHSDGNLSSNPDTFLLNDEGLVISQLSGTVTREYAADGKLSKTFYYNANGKKGMVYDYKASDGNTIANEIWDLNPKNPLLLITYEYEYLPHTVNTIGLENRGMAYFGKQDKNLLSVSKRTMAKTNDQIIENYHYEWDAQNRVVKSSGYDPENNYTIYTYY